MEIKTKINKKDPIKLISFCTIKEIKQNERKMYSQNGRKYLQGDQQGINLQNLQIAHVAQNLKEKAIKN